MAKDVKPRVKVPKSAAAGEAITIKTLISHNMESGQRKDKEGNANDSKRMMRNYPRGSSRAQDKGLPR